MANVHISQNYDENLSKKDSKLQIKHLFISFYFYLFYQVLLFKFLHIKLKLSKNILFLIQDCVIISYITKFL